MINHKKGRGVFVGLALGALGVVFGDIGTSPLYTLQAIFGASGQHIPVTTAHVYGVVSLIIWAVTIVVAIKYIGFLLRQDNQGEGGIMALVALLRRRHSPRRTGVFIILGLVGVALFYGDSAITPAISVLSAVEGIQVIAPQLGDLIVPITLVLLAGLFGLQHFGTNFIGKLFGPVMVVWFVTIGAGGLGQILQHPDVLLTLSPLTAATFFTAQPLVAFIVMGAVVLAVTGAEALYADMGHFGRAPIARAWFLFVFPALLLCYMGQGALLVHTNVAAGHSLVLLYPEILRVPVVLLATAATLIASQSVISGAFSLTRQAIGLNFLPKMLIRHTSAKEEGQIYLPFITVVLCIAVVALVVIFGSSANLANAYGVAISGALLIDSLLFIAVIYSARRRLGVAIVIAVLVFLPLDLLFASSSLSKLWHGGWVPLAIGLVSFTLLTTWSRGQQIVTRQRQLMEGPLQALIDTIADKTRAHQLVRVPGQAIYISHHPDFAPLALHQAVQQIKELHEKVVIVSVQTTTAAHVPAEQRAQFSTLKYNDGISYVNLFYGFHDTINVPKSLHMLRRTIPELDFDSSHATYVVSSGKIMITNRSNLAPWRKRLYQFMARNARSNSDYYKLPAERTIEMQSLIKL